MTSRTSPARQLLAALLAAAAVALSGCAGSGSFSEAGAGRAQLTGGSLARDHDLSGARFTVGSKEFTEQQILGKIMLYALRAAGAKVSDQTGLNGSNVARQALKSGDIDMYWEYSGTGWTQYLGHDQPVRGKQAQFRATARQDEQRNGISWLGPARFGNQYALARAQHASGPAGRVGSLSELAQLTRQHPDSATLCGASEFLDREMQPFQDAYGADFPPPQVYQNALALNYVNAAKSSPCQFAEVFTTDARIQSLGLELLDDDRGHFTTELAALNVRRDTARKHPQLAALSKRIGHALTGRTMTRLNGMVDLQGRTPDEAALSFLRSQGLIGR